MTVSTTVKLLTCVACLSASFWALKHTHLGRQIGHKVGHEARELGHKVGHEAGHLKDRVSNIFRAAFHHHHDGWRRSPADVHLKHGSNNCQKCLAAGKDFCISDNKCIPRATFQCKGPHDHITGDKEFSLHGNPKGIEHSMACPMEHDHRHKRSGDDSHSRLSGHGHRRHHRQGPVPMSHKAPDQGRPSDHADNMIEKVLGSDHHLEKLGKIRDAFWKQLSVYKSVDDTRSVRAAMANAGKMLGDAGLPCDRVTRILSKWATEHPHAEWKSKDETAGKRKEQRATNAKSDKLSEHIDKIKSKVWRKIETYKSVDDTGLVRASMIKAGKMFEEVELPRDPATHMLLEWAKHVIPEAQSAHSVLV
jgi:hypothetical protein